MTKTDIGIYRGLKEKFDPEVHIGFFITTDTGELLLGDQSLGQAISGWKINDGVLTLKLNTGKDIRITFPEATETSKGLLSAEDKAQLVALVDNLNSKVDKVTGKSLVADSEIEKLAGLPNSTELTNSIATAKAAGDNAQSDLNAHKQNTSNPHEVTKAQVGLGNVTNDAQVKRSEMGVANGVATLDTNGKVPSSQLPSYVDDIVDVYATYSKSGTGVLSNIVLYSDAAKTKVVTGEAGKIYQNITEGEPSYQFRWTGTVFSQTGASSLIIGEVAGTAYDGAKGKKNATDIANLKTQLTGLPDEEDLTIENGKMHLKDRDTSKGMGYKILRLPEDGILTQAMINEPNTVYEIRYDFDLNGATINVPENCILRFEGGSLSNGSLDGDNSLLDASPCHIFTDMIITNLKSVNGEYYCEWFDLDVEKCLMAFEQVTFIGNYTFDRAISIQADIHPTITFKSSSSIIVASSFSDPYLFDFKTNGYQGGNPANDAKEVVFNGQDGHYINLSQRCGFLRLMSNPDSTSYGGKCAAGKLMNLKIKGAGIGNQEVESVDLDNIPYTIPSDKSCIIYLESSSVLQNVSAATDRQANQPYAGIVLKGADNKVNRITVVINSIGMCIHGATPVYDAHIWGAPKCAFLVPGTANFYSCYGDWAIVSYYYPGDNSQVNITDHYVIGSPNSGNIFNKLTFIKTLGNACTGHANLIVLNDINVIPFSSKLPYYQGFPPSNLDLKVQRYNRKDTEISFNHGLGEFILPKNKWVKIASQWSDHDTPILIKCGAVTDLSMLGYISASSYSFFGESTCKDIYVKKHKPSEDSYINDIYIRNNTNYNLNFSILDKVHSLDYYVTEIVDDAIASDYTNVPYKSGLDLVLSQSALTYTISSKNKTINIPASSNQYTYGANIPKGKYLYIGSFRIYTELPKIHLYISNGRSYSAKLQHKQSHLVLDGDLPETYQLKYYKDNDQVHMYIYNNSQIEYTTVLVDYVKRITQSHPTFELLDVPPEQELTEVIYLRSAQSYADLLANISYIDDYTLLVDKTNERALIKVGNNYRNADGTQAGESRINEWKIIR